MTHSQVLNSIMALRGFLSLSYAAVPSSVPHRPCLISCEEVLCTLSVLLLAVIEKKSKSDNCRDKDFERVIYGISQSVCAVKVTNQSNDL